MHATTSEPQLHTDLRSHLSKARQTTDELFRLVRPETLYERPVAERHRLIFYLGHVEAFDWNMVGRYALSAPAFHPEFDRLFAFGIDPDESGLPADGPGDWPSIAEVDRYKRRVREALDRLLGEAPPELVHVAVEHRMMHAETLSYLLHELPAREKAGPDITAPAYAPLPRVEWRRIPAGTATLGAPRDGRFGWDNEFEETKVEVPEFAIMRHKVTNGDYVQFVQQGGPAPHFWSRDGNAWKLRLMFSEVRLPLDWPVYVTHAQASAYAEWAGRKLPSEAQYHRAAYGTPQGDERAYPWGEEEPDETRGNFDFHHWDPKPVNAHPTGDSAYGVSQMLGNGWEWTRDPFRPLPGFRKFEFYPGYSEPFFDDDHFVLKGASPRTDAKMARRSFRNWFRKEYKYVYAGFRCLE